MEIHNVGLSTEAIA